MKPILIGALSLLLAGTAGAGEYKGALAGAPPAAADARTRASGITLESLLNPPSKATTGVNSLRAQMLTDAARTVGFRGGMASRARVLADALAARTTSLDQMFQFATLINPNGTIPPVIVQAQDVTAFAPDQIRTANHVYRIEKEERFVSVPPTWRDYLFAGLPFKDGVELPVFEARPQDSHEMAIWRAAVEAGWADGQKQAGAILAANFNRLTRDYTGMLLYSSLQQQGIISATRVAEVAQTVTGNGHQITIGDTLRRVTGRALFDTDYRNWRPTLSTGAARPAAARGQPVANGRAVVAASVAKR
jgi:defect-in-organelle-trafficking protein DotC